MIQVTNLCVHVDEKPIISDLSFSLASGYCMVIQGANGAGKSSLLYALMGHPRYSIEKGSVFLDDINLVSLPVHERARAGLFLACQYPISLPGIKVSDFLRESVRALKGTTSDVDDINDEIHFFMDFLSIDHSFANRDCHDGFSGGEKKRLELLQLLLLKPKLALIDELDSGMDEHGRKMMINALEMMREQCPESAYIIVSHYPDVIKQLSVDRWYTMNNGVLREKE